ncbi:MAG: hypothetical protein M1498_03815 [Candidatus Thermoplasmatota archaeon]|nr:hypothetical protein [Candidatus Thermoplasmatota archaeon]
MTFELKCLGPYRVERTEDYDDAETSRKSYCEMIRVKGSLSDSPCFKVPSHLYKFSESELVLYMKDKKNLWRSLGNLLNQDIDISDPEIDFMFPVEMFPKVAKIVSFVRKRKRKTPMSDQERESRRKHMQKLHNIIEQNNPKTSFNDSCKVITLDSFGSDEKR